MVDKNFFTNNGPLAISKLAEIGGCEIYAKNRKNDLMITDLATIELAGPTELTFLTNIKYQHSLSNSKAGACITSSKIAEKFADLKMVFLVSANPYKSYAKIAEFFYETSENVQSCENNLYYVSKTAKLGKNVTIESFAYVGDNAKIGDNVILRSGSYIGSQVEIGDDSHIGCGCVVIYSIIGKQVFLHPGVKIGQDGFGFATDMEGHIRVSQLGRVIIGDKVNIGANSCIDRGANSDTVIGEGTQIDNLVQIGHNVKIGKNTVIVSQVGIAGSTKIGDFTLIGGQVGIAGHLNIGSQVQIAAKSGVMKDLADKEIVGGAPSMPINEWLKHTAIMKKLAKEPKIFQKQISEKENV